MKNRNRFGVSAAALFCVAGLAQAQTFPEAFDDIGALTSTGNWFTQNNSAPVGLTNYFQGNTGVFPAQASAGYLGTNFNNTAGTGTISNWFVTPALNLANGQQFTFYTRTVAGTQWGDRLQVRLSANGFSTNVGATATAVGDFTTLLLDINPTYQIGGVYPEAWQQYTINIAGLGGPTVGRIAFRYFVENGGPTGANSNYIGIDEATYNGTVATVPTGSCCLPNGTCQTLTQNACTGTAGVYGGNGSPCGSCPVFGFIEGANDVGDLPSNAQVLTGSGALTKIVGNIDLDDVDMYRIRVCDDPTFSATTHGGPALDSMLYLFNTSGIGLAKDDEGGASGNHALVTGQFVPSNGEYYLAVSTYDRDAADSGGQRIWLETNGGLYEPEWQPNGPAAAAPVAQWVNFIAPTTGSYIITLTGACFIGGTQPCYANCDQTGGLTANDFICFLTAYNQGASYADCDGVGGLTANDFICFVTAYNTGCS